MILIIIRIIKIIIRCCRLLRPKALYLEAPEIQNSLVGILSRCTGFCFAFPVSDSVGVASLSHSTIYHSARAHAPWRPTIPHRTQEGARGYPSRRAALRPLPTTPVGGTGCEQSAVTPPK
jgi:hypothetical protein